MRWIATICASSSPPEFLANVGGEKNRKTFFTMLSSWLDAKLRLSFSPVDLECNVVVFVYMYCMLDRALDETSTVESLRKLKGERTCTVKTHNNGTFLSWSLSIWIRTATCIGRVLYRHICWGNFSYRTKIYERHFFLELFAGSFIWSFGQTKLDSFFPLSDRCLGSDIVLSREHAYTSFFFFALWIYIVHEYP